MFSYPSQKNQNQGNEIFLIIICSPLLMNQLCYEIQKEIVKLMKTKAVVFSKTQKCNYTQKKGNIKIQILEIYFDFACFVVELNMVWSLDADQFDHEGCRHNYSLNLACNKRYPFPQQP